MTEGEARMLAWLMVGDRMPATPEDEALVQAETARNLALGRKAAARGYEISVRRTIPPELAVEIEGFNGVIAVAELLQRALAFIIECAENGDTDGILHELDTLQRETAALRRFAER